MSVRRDRPVLLALGVAAAYAATLLVSGGARGFVSAAAQLLLFLPGWLVMDALVDPADGWLWALAFGPLVGTALTSPMLLAGWVMGARGPWLLAAAPALASLAAIPARRLRGLWQFAATSVADRRVVLALLLAVPLVVARPFSLVGAEVEDGRAYRAYFTADYIWRRALVAEVAKGDVLPQNPFYVNDTLHYYWLPHLPNAIEYRAMPDPEQLDGLLLASTVVVDAAFILGAYGLTRLLLPAPVAAAFGVVAAFFFTSLEGLVGLWIHWRQHVPLSLVRYLNIDAVSRWFFGGMPIDSLYRILWYQPHHALAYLMGFLGLVAVVRRRRDADIAAFGAAGLLLGMAVLFSSFTGLMFTVAAAVYEGARTLRRRLWAAALPNAAAAVVPLGLAAVTVELLQYVDMPVDNLSVLRVGLNTLSVVRPWTSTFVSAGAILAIAAAGLPMARRLRPAGLSAWFALIGTSVWMYFFLDIRDHQDVYVGWRVGHVVFLALAPLAGMAWLGLQRLSGWPRRLGLAAAGLTLLASLPTFLIDAYNTQDLTNREMGAGFRWTLVLTPDEWQGLRWIQTHTRADARVQPDPYSRDPDTWAYVPAFAERRMAVGLPISMVPLHKYIEGSKRVRWVFDAPDPIGAYEMAARVGIDFILIGAPERHDHPGIDARYARVPHLFEPVFTNSAMTIYAVRRPGARTKLL